jgi:rubredoxin
MRGPTFTSGPWKITTVINGYELTEEQARILHEEILRPPPTMWQRVRCFFGGHVYEWNRGAVLIPAKAIRPWTQLKNKLKCHYCSATVGPQNGQRLTF